MCGDLVPQGLGDGTGFPKHHTLGTQAQSGISCLRRVRMKGQCLSVFSPTPFHLQVFPSAPGPQPGLSHFFPHPRPCVIHRVVETEGLSLVLCVAGALCPNTPVRKILMPPPAMHWIPERFRGSDVPQQPPDL